jgi:ABC-type nitrate/sulfonate/bicarbonate transport system substrate-binding protein
MAMSFESRVSLLLNWYTNPYHAPIVVAKQQGFYQEEGIQLAILEPHDPSDVTDLVGRGVVDFGVKAMIHTIAAVAKGYPVKSIATLLDEPPTGLIALKSSGIRCFQDIQGKKVGYIGEFGKKIIDNLAKLAGIDPNSYQTFRIGMNVTDAICRGIIDTGIGFLNFQKLELEHVRGETVFLRLDELAGLGCCCFCSIQFIVPEKTLQQPALLEAFTRATMRGSAFTTEHPFEAYELLCQAKPALRTDLYKKIFFSTLPFFSRNLLNVDRDWQKVARYTKHLNIVDNNFEVAKCYTNAFLPKIPHAELQPIACCLESEKE